MKAAITFHFESAGQLYRVSFTNSGRYTGDHYNRTIYAVSVTRHPDPDQPGIVIASYEFTGWPNKPQAENIFVQSLKKQS